VIEAAKPGIGDPVVKGGRYGGAEVGVGVEITEGAGQEHGVRYPIGID